MNNQEINIIQWNLNGFFKKCCELELITREYNPNIFCLQETNYIKNHKPHIQGFKSYYKNRADYIRASGGVTIFIELSIPSKETPIINNLEAVAATFLTHHTITTLCNICIPNQTDLLLEDIDNIIKQLPSPFIIIGDFNCHTEL
jgi:exonuclease III